MIAKGFKRNFRPIKMLTDEQIDKIHLGTLRILEETGLRIEHERALNLLRDNGCNVSGHPKPAREGHLKSGHLR